MSELGDFVKGLPPDPFAAAKTLTGRAEAYLKGMGMYPDRADLRVADLMADAMTPVLDASELVTDKDLSGITGKGVDRLRVLAGVARKAIRIRESEADGEDAQEAIAKLVAAARSRQRDETFGFAFLEPSEKKQIHEKLNLIREIIDGSDLPTRKKNALFKRLNALAKEVDSTGTGTDRFFAFMGDLAFTVGDMAEKAKPAIEETKEMLRIVVEARARSENVQLPKPKDWPLLPTSNDSKTRDKEQ